MIAHSSTLFSIFCWKTSETETEKWKCFVHTILRISWAASIDQSGFVTDLRALRFGEKFDMGWIWKTAAAARKIIYIFIVQLKGENDRWRRKNELLQSGIITKNHAAALAIIAMLRAFQSFMSRTYSTEQASCQWRQFIPRSTIDFLCLYRFSMCRTSVENCVRGHKVHAISLSSISRPWLQRNLKRRRKEWTKKLLLHFQQAKRESIGADFIEGVRGAISLTSATHYADLPSPPSGWKLLESLLQASSSNFIIITCSKNPREVHRKKMAANACSSVLSNNKRIKAKISSRSD